MKIYLAGPYSKGDQALNVKNAVRVADFLTSLGCHVKVPHLTHFWHMMFPRPYEFWLAYDLVELEECDAMVRIDGESNGADGEEVFAISKDIPVHHLKGFDRESLATLEQFIKELQ